MNNSNTKKIVSAAKIIILGLVVAFGIQYIYAFTAPPGTPTICPTGYPGCDAPINVSTTSQTKAGSLTLNTTSGSSTGLTVWGQSVFNYGGVGASAIQIIDGNQGAGKVLTSDASGNGTWATLGSASSSHGEAFFNTSGAQTWTAPAGVTSVFVRVWGAGGGGGAADCTNQATNAGNCEGGGGGGSGGYEEGVVSVTPGNPYTVTVGAAGHRGLSSPLTCSTSGGSSSFSTLEANGGYGGGGDCSDGNGVHGGYGGAPSNGVSFANPSTYYGISGQGGQGGNYCITGYQNNGGSAPLGGNGGFYGSGNGPLYAEFPGGGGYGADDCVNGTYVEASSVGAAGGVVIEW